MVAHVTIDLAAYTDADDPPISPYAAMVLDPGHITIRDDKVHVGAVTVLFRPDGVPDSVNGDPVTDGLVPVLSGVTYAVTMTGVLPGTHTLGPLADGTVTNLADVLVPGTPLTPDQATELQAQIAAIDTSGLADVPDLTLLYTAART